MIQIGDHRFVLQSAAIMIAILLVTLVHNIVCQADDFADSSGSFVFSPTRNTFRAGTNMFAPPEPPLPPLPPIPPTPPSTGNSNNNSLIWQPLPLRATFRPRNRPVVESSNTGAAGLIRERSINPEAAPSNIATEPANSAGPFSVRTFFPTRESSSSSASTAATTTRAPLLNFEPDDLQPTRQPMNRFRPVSSSSSSSPSRSTSDSLALFASNFDQSPPLTTTTTNNDDSELRSNNSNYLITNECFECICEASTNCNTNSKCQTSDVRHTRCGMFLISYDQWLTTELSKELVTREALARDAAADERAFYECVTSRECAQRLLSIYMQRNKKDCDRDGRIDCYDLAAVHHSGMDQCASESLLDSQYWSDFNACFGFGR